MGSSIKSIVNLFPSFEFVFVDVDEIDFLSDQSILSYFEPRNFDFLINCAAYTAVDNAEINIEIAERINASAIKTIAEIARRKKVRVVHISTDYVFSGDFNQPMSETDATEPISIYGKTKRAGEQYLLDLLPDAYVIRTAWLYSIHGKNFVKSIIELARQRSELGVVADQLGSPTFADDLALAILRIIDSVALKRADQPGVYHYTNEGTISWYDFAFFVNQHFGFPCRIKPIKTWEYKTLAQRPKYSVLDKTKIKQTFSIDIPHWSESLTRCLTALQKR